MKFQHLESSQAFAAQGPRKRLRWALERCFVSSFPATTQGS